ncbi:MAG: toprim domain-containing protein, partial [Myxococcota bacterium]
ARGIPEGKLKGNGSVRGIRGTEIHFRPDPKIFGGAAAFDLNRVRTRLEIVSYLHRGLRIVLRDEKTGERTEFHHPEGIREFLDTLVVERKKPPVHREPFHLERTDPLKIELSLQWTESPEEHFRTFANGIPTGSGGTHENGLKAALIKAIRSYLSQHKLTPKGVNISADDIREGIVALLSVHVPEPQFQGQTKERLNNAEVAGQVESAVRTALEQWLHDNKSLAEAIIARIVMAARARAASRAASQLVVRKSAVNRMALPGKLADCASTDPTECELFLVEGDSAGGNARQGRDRRVQAILPLRGKVLNAERASRAQVLQNRELQDVVTALGCGIGKNFDLSKLRYHRVFLLMDADSDGHHISTLLLTFFYRLLPGLLRSGHVFLAQPPLYRIDAAKETHWAVDDEERDKVLAEIPKNVKPEISRFKGLGEMTAKELWETTLDPVQRRALRVRVDQELETDRVFSELMGKDPQARFRFIMDHAASADAEELDV